MSESIQCRLEQMLPEIAEFAKEKIFTKEEINMIVNKRRAYEYKIHRFLPVKTDFLRYITYEMNLEKLVRKRFSKLYMGTTDSKAKKKPVPKSVHTIVRRIHGLYQRMLNKFRSDEVLWVQYFQWCKEKKGFKVLGRFFIKSLQIHPNNVRFWIMAASWEFESCGSPGTGRALFQKGLRINPKSKKLWLEYFKMELMFSHNVKSDMENMTDSKSSDNAENKILKELVIPRTVFKAALEEIPNDVSFVLDFLRICIDCGPTTTIIQTEILEYMKAKFPNDICAISVQASYKAECTSPLDPKYPFILKESINTFRTHLSSSFSGELMEYFILFLIKSYEKCNEVNLRTYLSKEINGCLQICLSKKAVTPGIAIGAERFFPKETHQKFLEYALQNESDNFELWSLLLNCINAAETDGLILLLKKALNSNLTDIDKGEFWCKYITHIEEKFLGTNIEPQLRLEFVNLINKFTEKGLEMDDIIEAYFRYCYNICGMESVKSLYESLISSNKILPARFYELYTEMVMSSSSNKQEALDYCRECWRSTLPMLEPTTKISMNETLKLWTGFMRFEILYASSLSNAHNIFLRAKISVSSNPKYLYLIEEKYISLSS